MNEQKLYSIYTKARAAAWEVYGQLVRQGLNKSEIYDNADYKKALQDERDAYCEWLGEPLDEDDE